MTAREVIIADSAKSATERSLFISLAMSAGSLMIAATSLFVSLGVGDLGTAAWAGVAVPGAVVSAISVWLWKAPVASAVKAVIEDRRESGGLTPEQDTNAREGAVKGPEEQTAPTAEE